jgi:hypothetical protein
MAVYRYEGDGKACRVVRLSSVPTNINGRRGGDYGISYACGVTALARRKRDGSIAAALPLDR